jgi:chromosome segregation ATPase
MQALGDKEEPIGMMDDRESHENVAMQLAETSEELGLEDLLEKLTVDVTAVKSGWSGASDSVLDDAAEMTLAKAQDTEEKEKIQTMQKAIDSLHEANDNLTKKLDLKEDKYRDVLTNLQELSRAIQHMQDRLNETNLSNAKLLYTNKVLINNSLNERQKNKIVESLSKSKTVEEAKVIFDTLQSATGSTLNKKQPKSLSEAVNKTTQWPDCLRTRQPSY